MPTSDERLAEMGAERVYIVELEPGDRIYEMGETVAHVVRLTDHRTVVTMTNGHQSAYGKDDSTVLIHTR